MKAHQQIAVLLSLAICALTAPVGHAQSVPSLINYQGKLTDASGTPLPNGTYGVAVRLWSKKDNAQPGNTLVWGQEYNVAVINGIFNVILGSPAGAPVSGAQTNDLGAAFVGSERYFGLTVTRNANGAPISNPQEIVPRQQVLSSPYAVSAAHADQSFNADNSTHAVNADNATHALVADQILSSPVTDRGSLVIENSPTNLTKAVNLTASLLNVQGTPTTNLNLTISLTALGLNGLDSGTALSSHWYYVWVVYSGVSNSVAGLASVSSTAPVVPASYTQQLLVGAFRTDTNANIVRFCQLDNEVIYDERVVKATSNGNDWTDLNLTDVVPPLARLAHIEVMSSAGMYPSTGGIEVFVRSKGSSSNFGSFYARARGGAQTTAGSVITDKNQVIQYKVTFEDSGGPSTLYVTGYTLSL